MTECLKTVSLFTSQIRSKVHEQITIDVLDRTTLQMLLFFLNNHMILHVFFFCHASGV